jgi:hypothetical protein
VGGAGVSVVGVGMSVSDGAGVGDEVGTAVVGGPAGIPLTTSDPAMPRPMPTRRAITAIKTTRGLRALSVRGLESSVMRTPYALARCGAQCRLGLRRYHSSVHVG